MNNLTALRAGTLAGTRHLRLACGLTEFPREILDLADTLEILDLTGNVLSDLPDDFDRLHRLRIVFLSSNAFTHVPAVLGRCPNLTMLGMKANAIEHVVGNALAPGLRWLILTDNRIAALPDQIGDCLNMQKLMLAGNRLTTVPEGLARCRNLELLRLSANRLHALPDWLFTLPRLAWLAIAGNPLGASAQAGAKVGADGDDHVATEAHKNVDQHAAEPASAPSDGTSSSGALSRGALSSGASSSSALSDGADWADIQLYEQLGEGASGVIHRAKWAARQDTVAVKLFKGAITSDGLPESEMMASMAAGHHAHLIGADARIHGHPDGLDGLIMPLVDPTLRNLAGPPSFESCTRDVYTPGQQLSIHTASHIAAGIARAAGHLHAAGLMHGDLYGHNILYAQDGHALLGDFGAASFYAQATPAHACERIEARAFGLLLQELLAQASHDKASAPDLFDALAALAMQCVTPDVSKRPTFAEIVQNIEGRSSNCV